MAKYPAKGVIVKYAATATPTTEVTNKAEVGFEDGERELIPSTTHENTTVKTYLDSGLRDTFAVMLRLLLDPADTIHELMRNHHSAGTLGYLTLVLPDTGAAQWAMSGNITQFSVPTLNPETGRLEADFTFKAVTVDTFTA